MPGNRRPIGLSGTAIRRKRQEQRHGEWLETLGSGSREQNGSLSLVAMKREEQTGLVMSLHAAPGVSTLARLRLVLRNRGGFALGVQ